MGSHSVGCPEIYGFGFDFGFGGDDLNPNYSLSSFWLFPILNGNGEAYDLKKDADGVFALMDLCFRRRGNFRRKDLFFENGGEHVWSAGVIIYILLLGVSLFWTETKQD